ncbi:MAG: hypothetical protein K9N62_00935 [Verrucomicrobia bacterium]|nr:hypothetical protein [Verrucomicrobiota bacterium]
MNPTLLNRVTLAIRFCMRGWRCLPCVCLAASVSAQEASQNCFAWDPSPGPDIQGYRLYVGDSPGHYQQSFDLGDVTEACLTNQVEVGFQYFAVAAYDAFEFESGPSNEIERYVPLADGRPSCSRIPDRIVKENGRIELAFSVQDGDTPAEALSVTVNASDPVLVPAANMTLGGSGTHRTLVVIAESNRAGSATIAITVTDLDGNSNGCAFRLTVVPNPPTIALLSPQEPYEVLINTSTTIPFQVFDSRTPADELRVEATKIWDEGVVTNEGLILEGFGTNRSLSIEPAADQIGWALIGISARNKDGAVAKREFWIEVTSFPRSNQRPSFDRGSDVKVLEDSGSKTADGWATNIKAGPDAENSQAITFLVSSDNSSLFSVEPAISPEGTLTFTPAPNANGIANLAVQLRDNGGTDLSLPQTFKIIVVPVNDPPSFVKGPDQVIPEDAAQVRVTRWATAISAGPIDESGQKLSFLVSNDNPQLFALQPEIRSNGKLLYTPAPNSNGVATVTVRIRDDGGTDNGEVDTSAEETFTITVNAVNDAPRFKKGPDQLLSEDAASQAVLNWATALSAGPADESTQALNFLVSNDNPGLFASQPAVSPDGTLTYALAANANGVAMVRVQIQDDGGTPNWEANMRFPQVFSITVLPVNDSPSFTRGGDVTLSEDAGAIRAVHWATGIKAGPLDESGQEVTFVVSNDNASLFSVPPTIGSDGTLTFTTAGPDVSGTARVMVQITDDGGRANGGNDTSPAQSFVITILRRHLATPASTIGEPDWKANERGDDAPALQLLRENSECRIRMQTSEGKTYVLEYCDSLSESQWQPLLQVRGDRQVTTLTDPSAPHARRFYRVRVLSHSVGSPLE